MFSEYALDPSLLGNWKDFRYFVEKFGWQHGRLIAVFPKRWKRLVYESLSCGDVEKKRIEEKLVRIDDRLLKRPGCPFDYSRSWLENCVSEQGRGTFPPFRLIVSSENPFEHPDVAMGDDLEEFSEARWKAVTSATPRRATEYANALELLLQSSQRLIFVDPYFDPSKRRFANVLKLFLEKALSSDRRAHVPTVEIHTSTRRSDVRMISGVIKEHLWKLIPAKRVVHIRIWEQIEGGERIHNRYVLTDRWGVMFGAGLDETSDYGRQETDDIFRLMEDQYKLRWNQYGGASPPFKMAASFDVVGGEKPKPA